MSSNERDTPPAGTDPLDDLLRRAQWPEPTPLQMARLESAWDRARPADRRVRVWAGISAAAAVLLVSLISWHLSPGVPDLVDDTPLAIGDGHQTRLPQVEPSPVLLDDEISRPATPLELAVLQAAEARAQRERRLRETDPLERAVARLIEGPQTSVDELETTLQDEDDLAGRLLQELPGARGPRKIALARLMAWLKPPDALPVLLSLWADPLTRAHVEPAVVHSVDVPTLASLIQTRLPFGDRVRLLSAIAARPDDETQELILLTVMDPNTRPAALAAARRAAPPAELLFKALSHQNADVRLAAALLLGEHQDPHVSDTLIALVRQNPARTEPWVALLQRDDAPARMIIHEARRHPQIMASVNTAAAARLMAIEPVQVGVTL